jgi:proline dehydrogenase
VTASLGLATSTSAPETGVAAPSADTGPPADRLLRRMKNKATSKLSTLLLPLVRRAARSHIGGESLDDAICVAQRLAGEGLPNTLGFWDTKDDTSRQVADRYLDVIAQLAQSGLNSYVSIKPPALRFDAGLATEIALAARSAHLRIHCDSHGPDVASASHDMENVILGTLGPERTSTTLPGRWLRSLDDANWVIDNGLGVRVVKGQWPDPDDPHRDMHEGFLEVVQRLAGRAIHVRVATHDVPLAAEAIARLRHAGTSCEVELLFGRPLQAPLRWAREHRVPVRVYVPFGKGYVPSAIGLLRHNPKLALHILRGVLTADL